MFIKNGYINSPDTQRQINTCIDNCLNNCSANWDDNIINKEHSIAICQIEAEQDVSECFAEMSENIDLMIDNMFEY